MSYSINDLLRIMVRLRDPDEGCPWDLEQDFQSILSSTLEECYELAAAIEQDHFEDVEDELGDLLFQVVFYAQLGREDDLFDFDSIVNNLAEKLLRRHPHVFAGGAIEGVCDRTATVGSVKRSWEAIKQEERRNKNQAGTLANVPLALPALPRAQKLQKRASQVNFDWQSSADVLVKVEEELAELKQAMTAGQPNHVKEELGDLLFSCVNLARHLGVDAEETLRHASGKFERRFQYMEAQAATAGTPCDSLEPAQWEALWQTAKAAEGQ